MPMVGDTLYLPVTEINAINKYEPQTFGGGGGNDSDFSNTPMGQMIDAAKRAYIVEKYPPLIAQDVKSQEEKFSSKLQAMPDSIAQSIYSMDQSNSSSSTLEQIENHIRSVDTLIAEKTQEYELQKAIGDKYYYGRDFFSHTTSFFITLSLNSARANYPPEKNYAEWHASLEGAYAAKYIMREIEYLGALKQQLQGDASQARADAEAKRIADEAAAEAARVAAEAEAKRIADEAAEQARLAAEAEAQRVAAEAAAKQAAQQEAQEVLQQLDGQLGAITGSLQQRVIQRVQGVDSTLSGAAGQVGNAVSSGNQAVQQTFNDVEQQVSQFVSSVAGHLNAVEIEQIVKAAQAQGEASVSSYTDNTNRLLAEASALGESQKQSVNEAVTEAANQIGARSSELNGQVQATPTRITAQNAQQLLQQSADTAYANVNAQADQAEAAVRSKVEEVTSALHLAQETTQANLREIPGSVQTGLARVANTYRFATNAGTALSIPGQGAVPLGEATAALSQAIKEGIAKLLGVLAAGPGAYIATFLTLGLYSRSTATEEQDRIPERFRYSLGVPPDQLGLPAGTDLRAIALAQGSVDLPFRLTNETHADGRSYVSVVNADGVNVPKSVPVRAVTLDPQTGLYTVAVPSLVPDQPPITLTWTPASPPGEQSSTTTTPAVTPAVPTYTGVELKPVVIEAETYPGVVPDAADSIMVFPIDSGIGPVYVMFSDYHYHQAPKELLAFPDAKRDKPKSSVRGGGKLRRRWKDSKGQIYEWDSQHGTVELYDKQGKHLGEYDSVSGNQTKPAVPGRTTQK